MRLIDANDVYALFDVNGIARLHVGDIDTIPRVDAVEVVHGRWIFKHNPITDPKRYFIRIVCSNCNLHTGQKSNYCPCCGAKMDIESEMENE